ncbi:Tim44/TimA family putative adaptor protein [Bauldia sp.]|uniref:Tim44/TimA family putative adaptor protein n=1 Tax=Bauldia sp. TaxID=2575872 RepID=UPI003BA97F0A
MDGFIDIYTIIFLVLAIVIFLYLRSILGRRTGNERPPFDPYSRTEAPPTASGDENVISLPPRRAGSEPASDGIAPAAEAQIKTLAPEGTSLNEALTAIATADRTFDPDSFLNGAKAAYEMVVTAFAEGDRKTLKQLLSREVYDGFVAAISEREGRHETIEFRFVGIDKAEITDASFKANAAHITIRFSSKLISATHDKEGRVVDGDPVHVADVTDIWTFSRDVNSRDPNWKLIATESVE